MSSFSSGLDLLDLQPFELARIHADRDGTAFLDSSLPGSGSSSLVAWEPELVCSGSADEWHVLEDELRRRTIQTGDTGVPTGAAIGWFSFDGSFRFGFYDSLCIYSHSKEGWLNMAQLPPPSACESSGPAPFRAGFRPDISQETYCSMVRRAQDYIAAGDIYQVCLAHRFSSAFEGSPWGFYETIRNRSPAPHAAFLNLGGTQILSASPEHFLHMSGNFISTRPIKGTRPRRLDPDEDERSAYDLITSSKEIAELVMITDLERNDLGKICEFGSVHVTDLLRLERFQQVFHLVSTIEGQLRPDVSHVAAVAACFPGGSISGAPKKRALQIIEELEPSPRGPYTGAIGYFGYNGESRFSIAIRTVVIEDGHASFHVGAGIVADSIPANEWQETLDKASGILDAASP